MKINKSITFINLQIAGIDKCVGFWYNVNSYDLSIHVLYGEEKYV